MRRQVVGKAENVAIEVAAADFGSKLIVTEDGSDPAKLVAGDYHPESDPADQDSSFRIAMTHLAGDFPGYIRIIDRGTIENAAIDNLVPALVEKVDEHSPRGNTSMTCANDDTHLPIPGTVNPVNSTFMLPYPGGDGEGEAYILKMIIWSAVYSAFFPR
jgi:hypothetical protein